MSPTMAEDRRLCDVRLAPALSLTVMSSTTSAYPATQANAEALAPHMLYVNVSSLQVRNGDCRCSPNCLWTYRDESFGRSLLKMSAVARDMQTEC